MPEYPGNPSNGLDSASVIPEDDDRIVVRRMFPDVACPTELWMSAEALTELEAKCKHEGKNTLEKCLSKLKTIAQGGFRNWEGEENAHIRHETGKTYRVRYKTSSLTRLIGFYEDDSKRVFVALAAIYKHKGDKYTAKQRGIIEWVDSVRTNDGWKRAP